MDEDAERINRSAAGEREAFDELVMKYQRPLYSMIYRMVSDHDDTADILQKTFVKAFTGLKHFERRSSFKTWLYQIAINLAKNLYRDRSRITSVSLDDVVIRRNPQTLDRLISAEQKERVQHALSRLPEKQRLTLLLRVQEEKKFEEIAQIMKSSLGTAKANYHHAVQKLKSMINVREKEDTAAGGAEERSIR